MRLFQKTQATLSVPKSTGYFVVRYSAETGVTEFIDTAERGAVVGLDGWIFDGGRYSVEDDRGVSTVSQELTRKWVENYLRRQAICDRVGAKFLVAIAPTKGRVYPEYLPEWRKPVSTQTRASVFLETLKGKVDVLNLLDHCSAHKNRGQLFLRFDNHWTGLGALIGAQGIVEHLRKTDARFVPVSFDDYAVSVGQPSRERLDGDVGLLDLSQLIGLPFLQESQIHCKKVSGWSSTVEITHEGQTTIFTYTNPDKSLPSAVVYADSFGPPLRNILGDHFRRMVCLNPWQAWDLTKVDFPKSFIERERPDYVIYLRWGHAILVGEIGEP